VYAELFSRTHFSFLRGASHPHELVERAEELGLAAIGICDRNGVYGIPKAYEAWRRGCTERGSKLRLITGSELTLAGEGGDSFLRLLAIDRAGYGLMCRLLTASHEGKPKGEARLSWPEFLGLVQRYPAAAAGLHVAPDLDSPGVETLSGKLLELFPGRASLPLWRVLDGGDRERSERALSISRRVGIPLVATGDVHYHVPERRPLQDTLTSIREGVPLDRLGHRLFSNAERYLKSPQRMRRLFRDNPQAIDRALEIAESCRFSPSELRYRYPSEWIPAGETAQSYLERLVREGAKGRYPGGVPADVEAQLRHELGLIAELRFADYFLTIWEIVDFARKQDILCQGRGSAANSIVCYCLGITAIDPVSMKLLFERFISVERGEPPDIDVDFEHERREEVIQHVYEKYGRDRAGMVAAIITYRDRSAIREVTKALGGADAPHGGARLREDPPRGERGINSGADAPHGGARLREDPPRGERGLRDRIADEIQGFPRHLSIHSGGFTLSADPIIETVPIEPARMEGRTIVQWDKEDLACIGLLKVDILALGMLTALQKTFLLVGGPRRPSLAEIPPDDSATYAMIQRADTVGTFQIESRAQMSMLGRLLPASFYDLVIQVAIVRPGPIVGQMVHPYLKRRRGEESSKSPHPKLDDILERTLGVPLFQEQVMKIAIVMAGFTPGEADELRRAIGAWRSTGSIEKLGKRLMSGLLANGLPQEFVDRLFKQVQGFAEYGFPESHAASFALIAYASAYLKCHHPAEFACGLLNSQPMGFYSSHTIVEDAKRHGVRILPVDPCVSEWDYTLENHSLRVGLRAVNGLGRADAERIVAERRARPFAGLPDFLSRVRIRPDTLFRFAMGEGFACFGISQRDSLWEILRYRELLRPESERAPGEGGTQLSLFSRPEFAAAERSSAGASAFAGLGAYETIRADYDAYGLSVRGHPMTVLRRSIPSSFSSTTTQTVRRAASGSAVRLAGLIIARQRPPTAKGTAFATLEDEDGILDCILQKRIFEKYEHVFRAYPFLVLSGKIQREANTVNLIVRHVERFFDDDQPVPDLVGETPVDSRGGELRVGSHDFH
jgi:error-prone DNA polymerase